MVYAVESKLRRSWLSSLQAADNNGFKCPTSDFRIMQPLQTRNKRPTLGKAEAWIQGNRPWVMGPEDYLSEKERRDEVAKTVARLGAITRDHFPRTRVLLLDRTLVDRLLNVVAQERNLKLQADLDRIRWLRAFCVHFCGRIAAQIEVAVVLTARRRKRRPNTT